MKNISLILGIIISSFFVLINNYSGNIKDIFINLLIIPILLLPYIINKFTNIKITKNLITTYILFVFFAYFLGFIMHFYKTVFLYDKVVHMLSGIFSAKIAHFLLKKNKNLNLNKFNTILFILSFSMLIASTWELFEYFIDIIFKCDSQHVIDTGINDTMLDILVALFGNIIYLIFGKKNN